MRDKVLIVDDQEINRDILASILNKAYEPVLATNGLEALEALGKDGNGFVLVLLDLMMPEMSGYEFLEHVNKNGIIDAVPVIVISAEVDAKTGAVRSEKYLGFMLQSSESRTVNYPVSVSLKGCSYRTFLLGSLSSLSIFTEKAILRNSFSFIFQRSESDMRHFITPLNIYTQKISFFP